MVGLIIDRTAQYIIYKYQMYMISIAIYNVGYYYNEGKHGLPQDTAKALELWHRSGKLGHASSNSNLGATVIMFK